MSEPCIFVNLAEQILTIDRLKLASPQVVKRDATLREFLVLRLADSHNDALDILYGPLEGVFPQDLTPRIALK